MRATLSYIEQPILFAASRAMAYVYRRFGISPIRQVPGWEMTVAIIELVAMTVVTAILHRFGMQSLVYALLLICVSLILDALTNRMKFKRLSNGYDANAYRKACAEAEENRSGALFFRTFTLLLPISACILFTVMLPPALAWTGWVAMLYYSLFVSKFYVRACEPPHPDEGDFFAAPMPA